jgi:WS/DGAT/MGAT family acyltransferase
MRQLRGSDARLVYADDGYTTAHVTLIHIYDPSTAPDGKVRFKHILAQIEGRLHRSPVFRQKLLRVPLELDLPYWTDDERFDLEYHVRHVALPSPGDWRQFCIQASRIHARPLDLSRPLWEVHVIERLDGLLGLPRGSFALLTKIHQAAIDLDAGAELTTVLHDATPGPLPVTPAEPWFPESAPSALRLLKRGALRSLLWPLRHAGPLARLSARLAPAAASLVTEALLRPEAMPVVRFNAVVSPHRVFETRRFPLADVDRIARLLPGATHHDVVLAVCAGGLRRYLLASDELPVASLTAIASADFDAGPGVGAQQWVLQRATLGTHLADPIERLAHIREQSVGSAAAERTMPVREFGDAVGHTPSVTLALTGRLLGALASGAGRRAPLANCSITHVPGPDGPLYLAGARMSYFSAMMPIADGLGLVFAVTSYDGMLNLSPTACREQLPDPERFAQCLRDSFQEYLALADAAPARAPRAARARKAPAAGAAPVRSARPRGSAAGTPAPAAPPARTAARPPRAGRADRRRSTAPAR